MSDDEYENRSMDEVEHEEMEQEGESKADRFKRLANPRFKKAVKALRLMKNLANPYSYEYTEEQSALIISKLRAEVDDLERVFAGKSEEDDIPEL